MIERLSRADVKALFRYEEKVKAYKGEAVRLLSLRDWRKELYDLSYPDLTRVLIGVAFGDDELTPWEATACKQLAEAVEARLPECARCGREEHLETIRSLLTTLRQKILQAAVPSPPVQRPNPGLAPADAISAHPRPEKRVSPSGALTSKRPRQSAEARPLQPAASTTAVLPSSGPGSPSGASSSAGASASSGAPSFWARFTKRVIG